MEYTKQNEINIRNIDLMALYYKRQREACHGDSPIKNVHLQ